VTDEIFRETVDTLLAARVSTLPPGVGNARVDVVGAALEQRRPILGARRMPSARRTPPRCAAARSRPGTPLVPATVTGKRSVSFVDADHGVVRRESACTRSSINAAWIHGTSPLRLDRATQVPPSDYGGSSECDRADRDARPDVRGRRPAAGEAGRGQRADRL
jgi:hypothetical protein